MKRLVILLCCVVTVAGSAAAQSLPRWTLELTAGAGSHTTTAGDEWYFDDAQAVMRGGIAFRLFGTPTRAAYAKLDYLTRVVTGDYLVCTLTPAGGCYSRFEPSRGSSVALGVRQMIVAPLSIGAAAGVGRYGDGAVKGGVRPYVEGEVAWNVLPHVAITATGRYMRWATEGRRYWFAPVMGGLQLH